VRTWIVTGGAGFIGSNFVRYALSQVGVRVVVLDKLTYAGSLESLRDVFDHRHFVFLQADIADRAAVDAALVRYEPQAVVNFAAESHVDRSIDGPRAFVYTNLVGAFELADASRHHRERLRAPDREAFRFLHVSTDEVYGSLGPSGAFTEDTPYAPNSPYAATKAGADHLVRAWHHTYGLPAIVTNCSNNYGPYQFPEKLIPLVVLNALEGRPLPIYGDGLNVRDWLYVEDHCAGIALVLEQGRVGEKYNIGGGNERTNLSIVDTICERLEAHAPARENAALAARSVGSYRELRTFVPDRPGHDRRYAIDATRVRAELGWRPVHDFDAGIDRTVQWYLRNRPWCEAVQSGRHARDRRGLPAAERPEWARGQAGG